MEYTRRGDRYENLSPKKYLHMIRPYLRDLINDHKPTTELDTKENDSDTKREEWKIQLVMQNNCVSAKNFEETRTIYLASKPVEIFTGSDTDNAIDKLLIKTLQRFEEAIETSKGGNQFIHESVALLYHYFMEIDIKKSWIIYCTSRLVKK